MIFKTITTLWSSRELIWEMAVRDLKGTSKGALLGILWVVINPLIQVTAYVVIVSFIFKTKLNDQAGVFDYALYVLSGMIPWQIMTKTISDAPMLIRSNTEIVKQVIYPIETLPLNSLLVGCFGGLMNFITFLALFLIVGDVKWTLIYLPLPILFLLLFIMGVSWIFSVVGVLLKDLREMVSLILMLMVYFSPVILNESMVGGTVWRIIMLNPLSHIIVSFRDVFWGSFHFWSWMIFLFMSLGAFLMGHFVIHKAKRVINEYI